MNRRKLLTTSGAALVAGSIGVSLPARAGTVAGFGGGTEVTQLLNNFQLIGAGISAGATASATAASLVQDVLSVQHQFAQLQAMLQNLQSLPQRFWQDIRADFQTLKSSYDTTLGLAWTNADIDTAIRNRFTPFEEYRDSPLNAADFATEYAALSRDTQVTAEDILRASNTSVSGIETELDRYSDIQLQSNAAVGEKQLLQIGHDLAAMEYKNGIELRNLLADNNKAMIAFESQALEIETRERGTRDRFFSDSFDGTTTLPAIQ